MIKIPAHKQTDPNKKPGQQVFDQTLADYIHRKVRNEAFNSVATVHNVNINQPAKKKLSFDAWWYSLEDPENYDKSVCSWVWKAAQENV